MAQIFTVNNIKGSLLCAEDIKISSKTDKAIVIEGLLLPRDKVSRNGVLYDWQSIQEKHKALVGCPVLFNHIHDTNIASFGKVTESWLKEEADEKGPAGWYYKAELDPASEYTEKVLKGYLNKVSIQLMASKAIEEYADNGDSYQRAYIADPLEMSLVNIPGFKDTTIEVALAEAFKKMKEKSNKFSKDDIDNLIIKINQMSDEIKWRLTFPDNVSLAKKINAADKALNDITEELVKIKYSNKESGATTSNNSGATVNKIPEKEASGLKVGDKISAFSMKFNKKKNGKIVGKYNGMLDVEYDDGTDESIEEDQLNTKKIESLHKEDHIEKGLFPMDEFHKGMKVESQEHKEFNPLDVARIVIDHLKEDEYYYSKETQECAEYLNLGEEVLKQIFAEYKE